MEGVRIVQRRERLGARADEERQQRVEGAHPTGAVRGRTVVHPGSQRLVPPVVDSGRQRPGRVPEAAVVRHRRQLQGVPRHQGGEAHPTHREAGVVQGAPGDRPLDRGDEVTLGGVPPLRVPPAVHDAVPPRAVVAPGLPGVAQLDEPARRPVPPLQQEAEAELRALDHLVGKGGIGPSEDRDGVPVHRGLRDGAGPGAAPEPGMGCGDLAVVAEVGDDAVRPLRTERAEQLLPTAVVAEAGPDHRVEAAVPQPLPRVRGGVRDAEAGAVRAGAPRRLQDRAAPLPQAVRRPPRR